MTRAPFLGFTLLGWLALGWLALGSLGGCAPRSAPSVQAPPATETAPASDAPEDPRALRSPSWADSLAGVPAADAACPSPTPLPAARTACQNTLERLAQALDAADGDPALAELETCSDLPPGIVRALRAERAPTCADRLLEKVLLGAEATTDLPAEVERTLVGLFVGARLGRLVQNAPVAPVAATRAELEAYFADRLFPWATEQAQAVEHLSREGASLSGYARGVVAIEAAMADLRFVEMARSIPLPREMQDPEVQTEYYAALDQALEPRKARGRDAALVGLGEFSRQGIIELPRLSAARRLIASVYAGNRITSLDALLVPDAPACSAETPVAQLARTLPTPYAAPVLASEPAATSAAVGPCFLSRGLPTFVALAWKDAAQAETLPLLARAHFELGRTYVLASAFVEARTLYERLLDGQHGVLAQDDEWRFLTALSAPLAGGPEHAAALFQLGPRLPEALGETAALEALATKAGPWTGAAAFDAAYLRELTAPAGAPDAWKRIAALYDTAARKLSGAARTRAQERAKAARATGAEVQKALRH